MLNLLINAASMNDTALLIANIMKYVLIATIVLGVIFLFILVVFIVKRMKYLNQVKKNKQERDKLLKEEALN